jgi:D-alanyl-D-alanine dipeptidase
MMKLQNIMEAHGFVSYRHEWWHYDFSDWKSYPVLDISYQALIAGEKTTVPVD